MKDQIYAVCTILEKIQTNCNDKPNRASTLIKGLLENNFFNAQQNAYSVKIPEVVLKAKIIEDYMDDDAQPSEVIQSSSIAEPIKVTTEKQSLISSAELQEEILKDTEEEILADTIKMFEQLKGISYKTLSEQNWMLLCSAIDSACQCLDIAHKYKLDEFNILQLTCNLRVLIYLAESSKFNQLDLNNRGLVQKM